jgi:tRNA(Arg) A34 adenosine deaminase TadA
MEKESIMQLAIDEAKKTMNEDKGGPFGAVIIDKKGNII